MKFVVEFVNSNGGSYVGGLRLLDQVRTVVPNVKAEKVPEGMYASGRAEFELTEQEARDSNCFETRSKIQIKVVADDEAWASLVRVEQVNMHDNYVEPVFSYDRVLLDAWVRSDYAYKFHFPYVSEDEEIQE